MDAKHAIVFCSVEAVPSADTTKCVLGINLSVGLSETGVAQADALMRPWYWGRIQGFRVRQFMDDVWTDLAYEWLPLSWRGKPLASLDASLERLRKKLDADYELCTTDCLVWKGDGGSGHMKSSFGAGRSRPWHTLVANLSTYPAPIPQYLNLSFFIRIGRPADDTEVAVAPVLPKGGPFGTELVPSEGGPASSAGFLVWEYTDATDIVTYVQKARPATPAVSTFLDLASLWVRKPATAAVGGTDWREGLEDRLADSIDLPGRLISLIQHPAGKADQAVLRDMIVASLHDALGTGLEQRPDGGRLANDRIAPGTTGWMTKEEAEAHVEAIKDLYATDLTRWRGILTKHVSGAETALDTKPVPDDPQSRTALARSLQHLHSAVREPTISARILAEMWSEVSLKRPFPSGIDYRHALALEALGRLWSTFRGSAAANAELNLASLGPLLQGYVAVRFQLSPPASALLVPDRFFPSYKAALSPQAVASLFADLQDWGTTLGTELRPPSDRVEPTRVPHGLTLDVDTLAAIADNTHAQDDLLTRVGGFGVLMRRRANPKEDWMCVNLADPVLRDDTVAPASVGSVLVPLKLGYHNDLRQATVTYDNQPLVAANPLAKGPASLEDRTSASLRPVVRYEASSNIPGLVFGDSYDLVPFLVSNSGGLPKEISGAATPWELDPAKLTPVLDAAVSAHIRTVDYKRRVPVGHLRASTGREDAKTFVPPPVPETVYPRLRDILANPLMPQPSGAAAASRMPDVATAMRVAIAPLLGAAKAPRRQASPAARAATTQPVLEAALPDEPQVVLSPFAGRPLDVWFRKPRTNVDTWSRWLARAKANRERRIAVWSDYLRRAGDNHTSGQANGLNVAVDDPAVADRIVVALWRYDETEPVEKPVWLDIPPATAQASALDSEDAGACRVTVECRDTRSSATLRRNPADPRTAVAKLPKGAIYRLTAYACLDKEARDRFDSIFTDELEVAEGSTRYWLVAPWSVWIETATDELLHAMPEIPEQDEAGLLWRDMQCVFNRPGASLDVHVPAPGAGWDTRFVKGIELRRQAWRWSGRPPATHPVLAGSPPPNYSDSAVLEASLGSALDGWDAQEFGHRPEADSLLLDMKSLPPGLGAKRTFQFSEALSGDPRAAHYRFAVTAISRYEGLLRPSQRTRTISRRDSSSGSAIWRRAFVPFREVVDSRVLTVPVPKVRLVLPLTEGYQDVTGKRQPPGLLVVLDETWFQFGGIGERLAAEVVLVKGPTDESYYEGGPDPIVASRPWKDGGLGADSKVVFGTLEGPVGHTLDRVAASPSFRATSFVLPQPTIGGEPDPNAHPWAFYRVCFQRVLEQPRPDLPLASERTAPFWVQYLPDFTITRDDAGTEVGTSGLRLAARLEASTLAVSIVRRGGGDFVPKPSASEKDIFSLYLLLTRRVIDVTGRRGQEVYVDVCQRQNGRWVGSGSHQKMDFTALRGRLLEVQHRGNPGPNAADLWGRAFGTASDAQRVRIVGIGDPIEAVGGEGSC